MKRFDFDELLTWILAGAVTWVSVLMFLLSCAILQSLAAEPVTAQDAEPEATAREVVETVELIEAVPAPSPVVEVDQEVLEQLAIGIYREGGSDLVCDRCRLRIGDVMLNRVADDRFPDTMGGVLTQKGQYGTMHRDGIVWPDRADNQGEAHAVERARDTAERLLRGEHSELYGAGYIFQSEFPDLGTETLECCGIYYAKG